MNDYSINNNNNSLNIQHLKQQLGYTPSSNFHPQMTNLYTLNLMNSMSYNMPSNIFVKNFINNNNNFSNNININNPNNIDNNMIHKLKKEVNKILVNDEKLLHNRDNVNNYVYNFLNFNFKNSSVDYQNQNIINKNTNININENLNDNNNNKNEINKKNLINIDSILNGIEKRTLVKLSPIPINYSSIEASKLVDKYLKIEYSKKHRIYNGIYVPLSETINKNFEFCLVNLIKPEYVVIFYLVFNGLRLNKRSANKICSVVFADQQEDDFWNKENKDISPLMYPLKFDDIENSDEYARKFFNSRNISCSLINDKKNNI